ncbi:NAD(P)-binding protein [Nannocystis pusilla]|uniref:NAD(P)-binding protein n=1 Tax=Nannocystis pusilla TaxID=889268 RepID=UPI003DA30902
MSAGPPTRPRKLAVFGGGLGSLSAVFALTELPDWRERYDITVYQIGWRLGGKARSGRNLRAHARSEALGHHVWFGWYDNAFALARRVYAETRRAPGAPLATFKEAFKPCDHLLLGTGDRSDRTPPWKMSLPRSDSLPGDGAAQPSVWHFAQTLLLWAIDCIPRLHPQYSTWSAIVPRWPDASRSLWPALMRRAGGQGVRAYDGFDPQSPDYDGLLRRAAAAVHGEDAPKTSRQRRAWAQPLTHCGEHSLRALVGLGARQSHPQFTIMVDLALATVRGILHDGLDRAGFSAIDDQDLRAWLRRHGASEESLASTVLVALYADHMSYESGDVERPVAAAGALLRAALRRYLAFSGALYYTPAAGLGEVLFAPLYRLLRDRGVRFRFFHKLKHLCPNPRQPAVSAAVVGRQIELAPGVDDYEPLIKVKGLPCWPSRPLYSQIVLGDDPVIQAIDFEANESPEVEEVVLRAGIDFDDIVLGVPPPALAGAAREPRRPRPALGDHARAHPLDRRHGRAVVALADLAAAAGRPGAGRRRRDRAHRIAAMGQPLDRRRLRGLAARALARRDRLAQRAAPRTLRRRQPRARARHRRDLAQEPSARLVARGLARRRRRVQLGALARPAGPRRRAPPGRPALLGHAERQRSPDRHPPRRSAAPPRRRRQRLSQPLARRRLGRRRPRPRLRRGGGHGRAPGRARAQRRSDRHPRRTRRPRPGVIARAGRAPSEARPRA